MSSSAEHMSWEERHNRVAQALKANPGHSKRAIASELKVSEGTVRYQKKKLDGASPQSPASVDPVAPQAPACLPLSLLPLSARTPSAEVRPKPSTRAMALKLDVSETTARLDRRKLERFLAQSSASVRPAALPTKPIKARLSPTQSPSTLPLPRRRPILIKLPPKPVPRSRIANSPPEKIGLRTMLKVLQNS